MGGSVKYIDRQALVTTYKFYKAYFAKILSKLETIC
jgi:hypothetical protein